MRSLLGGLATLVNRAPVAYVGPGQRLSIPWVGTSGAEAQMRAMGSVGTLFAIVNRTSNATSQVHWRLWRTAPSGRREDRVEVTRHLALDLWRKPNPFMTGQEFVESTQQHVDLTGEGWWVVERDARARSIPLGLWPVRPDRMEPVPSPTEFLAGYIYHGPDGREVPLRLDEVIQLRMPNPLDPYRGMGPVQAILTDLDSARYSAEWNRNFFRNSAEPGGIIEVDKRLSDDEFDEMSTRWNEQHRGVANAHRVAVIEQGKWVNRTFTMRDMQFTELRSVSRDVIREAFGIPKFAVGDVDDVNRATADASSAWFGEHLTVPRLERFKGALNNDFLPMFGSTAVGLEFDYDSPVAGDEAAANAERTSKATAAKTLTDAGYDPAEVLAVVGLPPMRHTAPAGPPALPAPTATLRRPVVARVPRVVAQEAAASLEEWEQELEALTEQWAAEVTPEQVEEAVEQVEEAVDEGDLAALAALLISSTVAAGLLADSMIAVAVGAAQAVLDAAEAAGVSPVPDVTVDAQALTAAAQVRAALMASALGEAAGREALRVAGPDASGTEVAEQVRAHLDGLSDRYVRDQLGGALWSAVGAGRLAALEVLPEPAAYVADEVRDRNTCGPCREVDGREYTLLSAALLDYPTGAGYVACEGGIRCRGLIEPRW
ncbi:phage portal protein [Micromonospora sp. KC207]|uniref:phage portal protein n=1 Tax=Micromonospora sp. KC207 TaxID=2530377 RepID=UPI00104F4BD5|nr:phage portal protein [Micromonospora sp. KC207]TDC63891.1 phage portal protein [Micromonospora sp. KC207]